MDGIKGVRQSPMEKMHAHPRNLLSVTFHPPPFLERDGMTEVYIIPPIPPPIP